jgi:hypothetical protein
MELMLPQLEQHLFPQQGVIASAQSQNEKLDPAKP